MRIRHFSILVLGVLVGSTSSLIAQSGTSQSSNTHGGFMLFGGIGLPSGDFAKADVDFKGSAKQGYFGGAEIMVSVAPSIAIILNVKYLIHKYDDSEIAKQIASYPLPGLSYTVGSYTAILPMAGIRLYTMSSIGLFVDGEAGYIFAKSPELTITGPGVTEKVESQSGNAFAYGASAGIDIGNTLVIGASYIASKPKFDLTANLNGAKTSETVDQAMNVVLIFAGIRF
jgi:hypothetical protein